METAAKNVAAPCSPHGEGRAPIGAFPPAVDVWVDCGPVSATIADLMARGWVNVRQLRAIWAASLRPAQTLRWSRARAPRGQRVHLAPRGSCEDLEGVFLPGLVPLGWAAVVRPDKTIVHDGPATDANHLVRESLALLGDPVSAPTLDAGTANRTA